MCWKVIDGKYISRKRDVWRVPTKPLKEAHFATYPHYIIKPCLLAGCPVGGVVIDPFMGAGTTALVARELKKRQQVIVACRLFLIAFQGKLVLVVLKTCTCRFGDYTIRICDGNVKNIRICFLATISKKKL